MGVGLRGAEGGCQGRLLFNALLLRGRRMPDLWSTSCLVFAPLWSLGCVEPFSSDSPAVLPSPVCLSPQGFGSSLRWPLFEFYASMWSYSSNPQDAVSDKFSSSAVPRVSQNRFIKHTGETSPREDTDGGSKLPAKYSRVKFQIVISLIFRTIKHWCVSSLDVTGALFSINCCCWEDAGRWLTVNYIRPVKY